MTELARFFGLIVRLYYREHGVPHIHVIAGDDEAAISLVDGRIIEGSLPAPAFRLVMEWIYEHHQELREAWVMAQSGKRPKKVPPMKTRKIRKTWRKR